VSPAVSFGVCLNKRYTEGDAVTPALDSPFALCPEIHVNRVTGHEHPAKGADVDSLFFRGNMADSSCKRLRPRPH